MSLWPLRLSDKVTGYKRSCHSASVENTTTAQPLVSGHELPLPTSLLWVLWERALPLLLWPLPSVGGCWVLHPSHGLVWLQATSALLALHKAICGRMMERGHQKMKRWAATCFFHFRTTLQLSSLIRPSNSTPAMALGEQRPKRSSRLITFF